MKKILALVLALAMIMLFDAAMAENPSKRGGDYNDVVPPKADFVFGFSDAEELVAWANNELTNMANAESVLDYFGNADEITAIVGEGDCTVNEMQPVYAENYEASMGAQEIQLSFATPYENGTDVAVMVGFETGKDEAGNPIMEWVTFAGKVQEDGSVLFTLDPETILRVQENNALLAVVNGNGEGKTEFVYDFTDNENMVALANDEAARLAEAESVQDYFGQAAAIAGILGDPEYTVSEIKPVYAANYEESMGEQEIKLAFETPYEKDATVAVMVGFKGGEDAEGKSIIEWNAFSGKVLDNGVIAFMQDSATILRVQEDNALLAIVSK